MKKKVFTYKYKENSSIKLADFIEDKVKNSIYLEVSKELLSLLEVKLNSLRPKDFSTQIKSGDKIEIAIAHRTLKEHKLPVEPAYNLSAEEILFEDKDILIINKPSGHPSAETLDPRCDNAHAMAQRYAKKTLILLHRLDVETSGALMLAKNKIVNKPLQELFSKKRIQKLYLAVVNKKPEKDSWEVINLLAKEKSKFLKMKEVTSGGDKAHTRFFYLKNTEDKYLVQATPITGRTHQIRVHLSLSGLPICGDKVYGSTYENDHFLLHCEKLRFTHPLTGEKLEVEAPKPANFF